MAEKSGSLSCIQRATIVMSTLKKILLTPSIA